METSVQNLPLENLIRPEELMEEIGIKKDTFYKDLKFLGIVKVKDENGLLCITQEDAERIRALREHIQETGKRQGFDDNDIIIKENLDDDSDAGITENPDISTINEQENKSGNSELRTQNSEQDSVLSTNNSPNNSDFSTGKSSNNSSHNSVLSTSSSSHNSTEDSALIKSNENNSSLKTQNDDDIYVAPEEPTDNMNLDGLVREAAELKAREVAMPDLVKRAIADEMTEDDLPEDLKEKVNLAREAANPKFTPSMVAKTILERYRQGKVG